MFILMAWSNENWAPVACFQTEESAERAASILTQRISEGNNDRGYRDYFTVVRAPLGSDIIDTGLRYLMDDMGFPIDLDEFTDGDPSDLYHLATVVERDGWASYTNYDGEQRLFLSPEEPTNDHHE